MTDDEGGREPGDNVDGLADYRDFMRTAHWTATRDFDRLLTALASSALAISLVFIHDIAPNPQRTEWVVAAWICFAGALLALLASLPASIKATRARYEKPHESHGNTTRHLNTAAAWLFGAGVVTFVVFAALNVNREAYDGEPASATTTTTTTTAP